VATLEYDIRLLAAGHVGVHPLKTSALEQIADFSAVLGKVRPHPLPLEVRQRLPGQTRLPPVEQTLSPWRADVLHRFVAPDQRPHFIGGGTIPQRLRRPSPSAERPVTEGNSGHEKRPACTYKASLIEVETVAGGSPCELRLDYSTSRRE